VPSMHMDLRHPPLPQTAACPHMECTFIPRLPRGHALIPQNCRVPLMA
jgi:hypothetical protein